MHCLTELPKDAVTRDHVFPSSWYTDDTPTTVQRWTVPSCQSCNETFGKMEKELFLRLGMCIDPAKAEATGINQKLLRSFGVGPDISGSEREIRKKLKDKIMAESIPYAGHEVLPSLGLHQGFAPEAQRIILIPANLLFGVLKKVFRGTEYVLNDGRYITPPYSIELYHVHEEPIGITQIFGKFAATTSLGPGFELKKAAPRDDRCMALYKVTIWGTLISYASIDKHSEISANGSRADI